MPPARKSGRYSVGSDSNVPQSQSNPVMKREGSLSLSSDSSNSAVAKSAPSPHISLNSQTSADSSKSPISSNKRQLDPDGDAEGETTKRRRTGSSQANLSDSFCWHCHRDGSVVCCELCPRVYHMKCLGICRELPDNWVCPECEKIIKAECIDTRSKSMSMISIDQLCQLLKFALNRMTFPGTEVFQKPVEQSAVPTYSEFVTNPVDLRMLERNIKRKQYGSTEAFLADVKWIQHNSIIFNGPQNKLSVVTRSIMKICKHEMNEIEICPDCYLNSCVKQNNVWFCEPCRTPHTLVWAKLKGYPFWPAKALREQDGQVDVRFFGAHDRSWVPVSQVFLLSKDIPTPLRKGRSGFETSMEELNLHIEKLKERFGSFEYAPFRTPYDRTSQTKLNPAIHPIKAKSSILPKPAKPKVHKSDAKPKIAKRNPASVLKMKYSSIITTRRGSGKVSKLSDKMSVFQMSKNVKLDESKVKIATPSPRLFNIKPVNTDIVSKIEKSLKDDTADMDDAEASDVVKHRVSDPANITGVDGAIAKNNNEPDVQENAACHYSDKVCSETDNMECHKNSEVQSSDCLIRQSVENSAGNVTETGLGYKHTLQAMIDLGKAQLNIDDRNAEEDRQNEEDNANSQEEIHELDHNIDSLHSPSIVQDKTSSSNITKQPSNVDRISREMSSNDRNKQFTVDQNSVILPKSFNDTSVMHGLDPGCNDNKNFMTSSKIILTQSPDSTTLSNQSGDSSSTILDHRTLVSDVASSLNSITSTVESLKKEPLTTSYPVLHVPIRLSLASLSSTSNPPSPLKQQLRHSPNPSTDATVKNRSEFMTTITNISRESLMQNQSIPSPNSRSIPHDFNQSSTALLRTVPVSYPHSQVESLPIMSVSKSMKITNSIPGYLPIAPKTNRPLEVCTPAENFKNDSMANVTMANVTSLNQTGTSVCNMSDTSTPTIGKLHTVPSMYAISPDSWTLSSVGRQGVSGNEIHSAVNEVNISSQMDVDNNVNRNDSNSLQTFSPSTSVSEAHSITQSNPKQPTIPLSNSHSTVFIDDSPTADRDTEFFTKPPSSGNPTTLSCRSNDSQSIMESDPQPGTSSVASTSASANRHKIQVDIRKYQEKMGEFLTQTVKDIYFDITKLNSQQTLQDQLRKQISQLQHDRTVEMNELKRNIEQTTGEIKMLMEKKMRLAETRLETNYNEKLQDAVNEAKKKQWCAHCQREAIFYCCWNTSYCDYPCQVAHWPEHMNTCTQQLDANPPQPANHEENLVQRDLHPVSLQSNTYLQTVINPAGMPLSPMISPSKPTEQVYRQATVPPQPITAQYQPTTPNSINPRQVFMYPARNMMFPQARTPVSNQVLGMPSQQRVPAHPSSHAAQQQLTIPPSF